MGDRPPATLKDPSTLLFEQTGVRRKILASYLAVVLLALPLWWSTTSIERLSLPTLRVDSLSSKELHYSINVGIDARMTGDLSDTLAHNVRTVFDTRKEQALALYHHLEMSVEVRDWKQPPSQDWYTMMLIPGLQSPIIQHRQLSVPLDQMNNAPDLLLSLLTPYGTPSPPGTFRHLVAKFAPRYRVAFTLLNEDASAGRAVTGWDIRDAISHHITPVLEQVSQLHNFTIESQVQFNAPLAFEPRILSNGDDVVHGLTQENLKVFINSAEWTLASSVSNDPVLHFVLFVPSASRTPLRILDDSNQPTSSDAFILPQWGGIVLLNLPQDASPKLRLTAEDLAPAFRGFRTQLLRLLGVSDLPPGVLTAHPERPITLFQLDTLHRQRALENAAGSKETLRSIVKLVDQIPNMPVGQDVRGDIADALSALDEVRDPMPMWSSPTLALQYSSRALTLASRAFFNPGMLALLYFPAEHKYAVYLPLFVPVGVSLVVTLLKEISVWRRERRERGKRSSS
ncbi:phosphatidylinositol-glycan biosynthesis class S protein-domain-containing protein [Gloeopeniophorella convolvens]|nr:phosphatidylinositol-glycan biosynthesis class S protein-domain-containing protein [Gloeopeniophorella convolvens]